MNELEELAERLASAMYLGYSAQAKFVTFDGRPLPSWGELGKVVQANWVAAAYVAIGCLALR